MGRLQGKVALITGAGTGMGRACMEIFAREGATVVGTGRRLEPLQDVLDAVKAAGGTADIVQCDNSDEQQCRRAVEHTQAAFGRVDILVNNAGMGGQAYRSLRPGGMESLAETPTEWWHEIIGNNLDSVYYMSKYVIPVMRAQGRGSIVNVSSTAAVRGIAVAHGYTAAKTAIQGITRAMAVRYGPEGIRTNCIAPGSTDTPMMVGSPAMQAYALDNPDRFKNCPLGRPGTPEEMAYACLYLASDEASYTNGVVIPVDGGGTACAS